ncbi:MAG: hypothetical protein ACLR4Z_03610 [Butyricicoccaceae bacterium]
MQRELISIPKMLLYALVTVLVYVIQTSVFGAHPLFGYHVDLLPAAVTAAALLDGPVEGRGRGSARRGAVRRRSGRHGRHLSDLFHAVRPARRPDQPDGARRRLSPMVLMNAFEMLLLGMLRYFVQLMREECVASCSCCIRRSAERSSRACCALSSICPCGASAAHFRGRPVDIRSDPMENKQQLLHRLPRCSSCCCCAQVWRKPSGRPPACARTGNISSARRSF